MVSIYYPPYGFGGDAIYLHRLCRELVNQGHEVDVIHCADSYHMFVPTVDPDAFPVSESVTVHKLESGVGMLSPLLSHQTGRPWLKTRKIHDIFHSKRFDVIHYHNISLFGPRVLEIQPPYPVVKLYTAHEHWLVCPMNVLWKNGSAACESPTCFSCTLRSARPPQLWRYTPLLERAAAHVDLFLTPSRFSREEHRRRGFRPRMEILPYFASPLGGGSNGSSGGPSAKDRRDAKDSTLRGSPHPRPYFLFVGRLEKIKGVQEVLPHFRGPGDYDLLVVGAGRYESELHRQAAGMERVRFVGWKNQNQLGDYYRRALGVVVPSVTYETFGIVVIEAFAHSKPVIVNDLGALPELVGESGGGFVYRGKQQLGEQLDRLARDEDLRQCLGSRGNEALREKWSAGPHIDRYESLIRQVREHRRDADTEPRAQATGRGHNSFE